MNRSATVFGALVAVAVASLGLATTVTAHRHSQVVILDEGKIGKAAWGAWLEPAAGNTDGPEKVCRNLALMRPTNGGLYARSESRECGAISPSSPAIESIDSGRGSKRRSVWLMIFAPNVERIYVNVGKTGGRSIRVAKLSSQDSGKLKVENLGFWVRGYAGNASLHRLISYDSTGATLSDFKQ